MRFDQVNDLFRPGDLAMESGVVDHEDGFKTVPALCRMPRAKACMVEWWFGWLGGTDQYKLWHPTDHLFSDWEGRTGNSHVGACHHVLDYPGGADGLVYKLPINFRVPAEVFDPVRYAALDGVAFCARIGLLEAEVTMAWKTHFARNTPQRYEMCNWFFVGQVESRDPDQLMSPDEVRPLRHEAVTHDLARHLHQHCTEEMSCLSEFLRVPYRQVTQDQTL